MGQLAQGSAHRVVPNPLRATDLSQEPLSETRAHEARRVPSKGNQTADSPHARPRRMEEAGTLTVARCASWAKTDRAFPPTLQTISRMPKASSGEPSACRYSCRL